eukprot:IDg2327t1
MDRSSTFENIHKYKLAIVPALLPSPNKDSQLLFTAFYFNPLQPAKSYAAHLTQPYYATEYNRT